MYYTDLVFEHMENDRFSANAYDIFNILADNMTVIAPTGNTREEDYNCWYGCVSDGLKHNERKIVLIKDNNVIIGFFQYYLNEDTFMMEEIQLMPEYHGKGVFRALYNFVIPHIKDDIKFVEAYASVTNSKSIGILEKFGLINIGLNKNGRSYHFKGYYSDLLKWYNGGNIYKQDIMEITENYIP